MLKNYSSNNSHLTTKVKKNIDDLTLRDRSNKFIPSQDKVAQKERDGTQRHEQGTLSRPVWLTESEQSTKRHDGDDEAVNDDRDDEMGLAMANGRDDGTDDKAHEADEEGKKRESIRGGDVHERTEKISNVCEMSQQECHESENEHDWGLANQQDIPEQRKEDGQLKNNVC